MNHVNDHGIDVINISIILTKRQKELAAVELHYVDFSKFRTKTCKKRSQTWSSWRVFYDDDHHRPFCCWAHLSLGCFVESWFALYFRHCFGTFSCFMFITISSDYRSCGKVKSCYTFVVKKSKSWKSFWTIFLISKRQMIQKAQFFKIYPKNISKSTYTDGKAIKWIALILFQTFST